MPATGVAVGATVGGTVGGAVGGAVGVGGTPVGRGVGVGGTPVGRDVGVGGTLVGRDVDVGADVGTCEGAAVGGDETTAVGEGCADDSVFVLDDGMEPFDPPPPHAQIIEVAATTNRSRTCVDNSMK